MSGFEPRKAQLRPGGDELQWVILGGRGSGKSAAMLGRIIDRLSEEQQAGRAGDAVIYVANVPVVSAARRYAAQLLELGLVEKATVPPRQPVQIVTERGIIDVVDRFRVQDRRPLMIRRGVVAADDLEQHGHYVTSVASDLMRMVDLSEMSGGDTEIIVTVTPPLPTPKWLLNLLSSQWVTSTRLRTTANTELNPASIRAMAETYSGTRVARATLDAEIIIEHAAEDEETPA